MWNSFPSENDKFAGYAKRMGELQAQAYSIEHNWNAVSIVRPSNVYGLHDNFDPKTGMVIPSLIARFASPENPIKVWGDGTAVRDFVFADDVADGMLIVVDSQILEPINIGSGTGIKISEVVGILKQIFPDKKVIWDSNMPKGDDVRIMDTTKALELGITPKTSLKDGITSVVKWYLEEGNTMDKRYNAFNEYR
jgi:GDP-L-fucose synthase